MKLDCREIKRKKLEELKEKIKELKEKPYLCVVQVGNNEASNVYVNNKIKLAEKLGYRFQHVQLDEKTRQNGLINIIEQLNDNKDVDGIIIQLPLPSHLDERTIVNTVSEEKDVDGLTRASQGKLIQKQDGFIPCTPKGVVDILDYYNVDLDGKNVVVVGRSFLVGMPLAILLTNRNATVTIAHSHTKNLKELCRNADVLVTAVGKAKMFDETYIKDGATVVDVGINRTPEGICGDVDFDRVVDKANVTPVPYGVGQMTVYELMENTYKAYTKRRSK